MTLGKTAKHLLRKIRHGEAIDADELNSKELSDEDLAALRQALKQKVVQPTPKLPKEEVPGPGQYPLPPLRAAPTTRFVPMQYKGAKAAEHVPGPGAYEAPPVHHGREPGIHGRPPPSTLVFKTPGPGAYEMKPAVGNEGTSPQMGARLTYEEVVKEKEREQRPGPGAYHLTSKFEKPLPSDPSWQPISGRKTLKPHPGPGSYDILPNVPPSSGRKKKKLKSQQAKASQQ